MTQISFEEEHVFAFDENVAGNLNNPEYDDYLEIPEFNNCRVFSWDDAGVTRYGVFQVALDGEEAKKDKNGYIRGRYPVIVSDSMAGLIDQIRQIANSLNYPIINDSKR